MDKPKRNLQTTESADNASNENTVAAQSAQKMPPSLAERQQCRQQLRAMLAEQKLLPPLTLEHLLQIVRDFLQLYNLPASWQDWCAVYASNIVWEQALRRIPRARRLLLLPICLRHHAKCQATYDDLGLICANCGHCQIPALTRQAEQCGLLTLVAESSSRVAEWVAAGEIQAVIGVSCLDALTKAFPAMNRNAIPGYAIPLNKAGCRDTDFDLEELQHALTIPEVNPLQIPAWTEVKAHLDALFQETPLRQLLACTVHEELPQFNDAVINSLSRHGKHYRPLLTFLIYLALSEAAVIPPWVDHIAVAIECFHKASLIHDDIEDDDDYRYGEETVHQQLGVPIAINVGDYLIGEGYRLLTSDIIPEAMRAELAATAALGHCQLSLGQAREFELAPQKETAQVLDTFRLKTAPAFRVAFMCGAIAAGQGAEHQQILAKLADALGIAYQLLDDLEDNDQASMVMTISKGKSEKNDAAQKKVTELYQQYRQQAKQILAEVKNAQLKIILAKITENILPEKAVPPPITTQK